MNQRTPAGAARRLAAYRLPTTGEAIDHLRELLAQCQFMALYRHYFPRKFAKARKGQAFRDLEKEFLELVNKRLFPICLWVVDELEPDDRLAFIPVAQVNPFSFYDDYSDDLRPAIRVLLALVIGSPDLLQQAEAQIGVVFPDLASSPDDNLHDWEEFVALCGRAGGRLAQVPEAMDVLGHDTGNFWLDFDEESGWVWDFAWNIPTMDELRAEWVSAQQIIRRFNQITHWLEARPQGLARVIDLWNRCLTPRLRS